MNVHHWQTIGEGLRLFRTRRATPQALLHGVSPAREGGPREIVVSEPVVQERYRRFPFDVLLAMGRPFSHGCSHAKILGPLVCVSLATDGTALPLFYASSALADSKAQEIRYMASRTVAGYLQTSSLGLLVGILMPACTLSAGILRSGLCCSLLRCLSTRPIMQSTSCDGQLW